MSDMEVWKPVPGWEDFYQVSSYGRVRSLDRVVMRGDGVRQTVKSRLLRPHTEKTGYKSVALFRDGKGKTRTVHYLVTLAFLGPRPANMEVRHLDGNPSNNFLENLRYGTSAENKQDTIRHGNHPELLKTHCKRGHLLSDENLVPSTRRKGKRNCLACQRAGSWIYKRPHLRNEMQEISDKYYLSIIEGHKQ